MTITDTFLIDFRARFCHREVQIDLTSDTCWTGTLETADASGVWLKEDDRTTWIPWKRIEAVMCPPIPEPAE